MLTRQDVVLLTRNAKLSPASSSLPFDRSYRISPLSDAWDSGLDRCGYRVHGRAFTDLSCMRGQTLRTLEPEHVDTFEIREHEDGTVFLYAYDRIPTFDAEDRVWDSADEKAIYLDGDECVMIHIRHGYRIGRINVHLGLTRTTPALDQALALLRQAIDG